MYFSEAALELPVTSEHRRDMIIESDVKPE